jgi:Ca-activated chloride channel homolog
VFWYHSFGYFEAALLSGFVLFYALYLIKLWYTARQLNTNFARSFIKFTLRSVIFSLLIISLLGPSFGSAKKEIKSVGKDIMICVDLSKSMDAFDIQPTRIEKIKFELKRIVDAFSSDRVGVIIFSSEAFMQCPLTYDQNALHLFIETMNTTLVPAAGTDFGPPLRMALEKLDNTDGPSNQAKSKVIVLVSDGEDFGEETNEVIDKIESENIKLFTLGIGTLKGGKINSDKGLKTDRSGQVVITKLKPEALVKLANQTGGKYFEINETRNDVAKLINTIDKIEGEFKDARVVDVSANKYIYFLAAAIFLLLIDLLINVRTIRI